MKKVIAPIIVLIILGILLFVIFTDASKNKMTEKEIIELGEEKYLSFLWIVDGAFNEEKQDGEFKVNGKTLNEDKKIFTCKYKSKDSNECIGNNFSEEFNKLFASSIDYDKVYDDGLIYNWHTYQDGKHVFTVLDSCDCNRMGLDHKLSIESVKEKEIVYQVSFENNKIKRTINKTFTLVLEDNEWKISKAYYYDLCGLKYYIN